MSYAEYQEYWEQAAGAELSSLQRRSAAELLEKIERGEYGGYYQIWHALQGRTTIEEARTLLLGILRSKAECLVRYHCAAFLLSLYNPFPDVLTPVKLSGHEK